MKVLVEAYGCTLNHGESEEFIEAILKQGHDIVDDESQADAHAIFTCAVIETTEKHMLKRIAQLSGDSSKKLLVCGCLGPINKKAVLKAAPHAEIYGPAEHIQATKSLESEGRPGTRASNPQPKVGILPIATGCRGNCSYCITKEARGPLKSRSAQEIKQRLEMLVSRNCAEIQICAQDTAVYGADIGSNLGALIRELESIDGNHMMRIGMMNPANVKRYIDGIMEAYESSKVFKFMHLPVQSGSDSILQSMNRHHTAQDFVDIVEKLRARFPDMAISTDIIVGFPGETDDDFDNSIKLMRRTSPDIINITRFSPRPGTAAHEMKRVSGPKIKARSKIITDLRFELTGNNYNALIGQKTPALATECLVENTTFMRTRNYRPILVSEKLELGRWYDIEITGVERVYLSGERSFSG